MRGCGEAPVGSAFAPFGLRAGVPMWRTGVPLATALGLAATFLVEADRGGEPVAEALAAALGLTAVFLDGVAPLAGVAALDGFAAGDLRSTSAALASVSLVGRRGVLAGGGIRKRFFGIPRSSRAWLFSTVVETLTYGRGAPRSAPPCVRRAAHALRDSKCIVNLLPKAMR